jgi:phosphohistidine phosphatase
VNKDIQRDLTASGRKEIQDVANSIGGLKLAIDLIASSPLRRALDTAVIVAKELKNQKNLEVWDELKPEAQFADLYRKLSKLRQGSSVLLVGHEPYLSGLISELISGGRGVRILLKKGGMAKVVANSFTPKPSGELKWLLTPRQIKRMT